MVTFSALAVESAAAAAAAERAAEAPSVPASPDAMQPVMNAIPAAAATILIPECNADFIFVPFEYGYESSVAGDSRECTLVRMRGGGDSGRPGSESGA